MTVLATDFGYGWVKAQLGDKLIQFPHALGTPDPVRFRPQALGTGASYPLTVKREAESHSYFVGEAAIRQSRYTWSLVARKRNPWELRALLAESVDRLTHSDLNVDLLVSGLPVAWYAEDQDEHIAALKGDLHFCRGTGQWHTVSVQQVAIVPQPVGTLLSLAFDPREPKVKFTTPGYRTGVLDIGHFTTDAIITDGSDYLAPKSFSVPIGISLLQEDLRRVVRQAYRRELSMQEADAALRSNVIRIAGEERPLPLDPAKEALASRILAEVQNHWGEALDLDAIVVTGGGAHILFDAVKAVYAHAVTVDEPELANLRGYRLYGEAMMGGVE